MLEGYKAYILPATAAVLLGGYFIFRPSVEPEPQEAPNEPAPTAPSYREQVNKAVKAAGGDAPAIAPEFADKVRDPLGRVVDRCRGPRPDAKTATIKARVEVRGAASIGAMVHTVEASGASDSFAGCVSEGARALKFPAPPATGSGTFEFEFTP